jgi:PAS domain S-box-containing protein
VSSASGSDWYRSAFWLLALACVYFLLAKLGLALASLHPSASPVWPPSGLALGAFLLWGNRVWPAIAIGAFFANATTFGSVASSLAIAAGNTLEAMITAWLLERWSGGSATFETPSGVAKFAGLSIAPGTMIAATIGVGSLALGGHVADTSKVMGIWMTWWLGDLGGQLLVTPVIVLWGRSDLFAFDRGGLQRLGALLLGTVAIGLIAFSPLIEQTTMRGSLAFFAIAPMLWAALRHNQRDTATAALVLCVFALWGTLASSGPFARPSLNDSFLLALTFVISTAIPSLVLSADVAVRRRSEERYRALIDNANDIVATFDLEGRVASINPAVERLLGYTPEKLIGTSLSRFVPEEQLPMHKAMLDRKFAGEPATRYEMEVLGKEGRRLTLEVNSRLLFDDHGKPIGVHAIARDATERKEAEARQALLVRELQHRTKNMLAVIQSIVSKTLRRSPDLISAEEALIGRLHALAHAQEFVVAGPGGGVPLRQVVEAELSAFAARTIITGEALVVGGAFAQSFSLLVHELATNAVKHGALSAERGRVVISWKIEQTEDTPQLHFSWLERGGPSAKPPQDTGLGTVLMSSIGKSQVAFKDEGFEYAVSVPLCEAVRGSD